MDSDLRQAVLNPNSIVQDNPVMRTQIQLYLTKLDQDRRPTYTDDPFLTAAKFGRINIVEAIIELAPESLITLVLEQQDPDGYLAVHLAAANGHKDVVRVLLEKKPGLCHEKDRNGWTPLHHAIAKARVGVMEVILQNYSAAIRDVTYNNETCFHIAVRRSRCEEIKLLLLYSKDGDKNELLNRTDEEGDCILHVAVSLKLFTILEDIVPISCVQINNENTDGLTALNLCDRGEKDDMIETLLSGKGAIRSVSLIALIDRFLHCTPGEHHAARVLSSGVAFGAIALLGNPLEDRTSQSRDNEEVSILDVLKGRHHSFWRLHSALSLTILFVFSMLILLTALWSAPTRLPLMVMLLFGVMYYFVALAANLSSFCITFGSLRCVPSWLLVVFGTLSFYLVVALPMVLGRTGAKLKRYFENLKRRPIIPL